MLRSYRLLRPVAILCMALLLIQIFPVTRGMAYTHTGGMYTQSQIDYVKNKVTANAYPWKDAYNMLMEDANAWLSEMPSAVAVWNVPGYYVDPVGHEAAKENLMDDTKAAYACALAYKMTGNTSYAEKTRQILNNWASVNTQITGADGDLASSYIGNGLVVAADLIRGYTGWTSTEITQFNTWLTNVYLPVVGNTSGHNNALIWSIYARLLTYHFMDNTAGFASMVTLLKSEIDTQIASDGHLPDECTRGGNSLWYTYFCLSPMTAASQVIYNVTGENLFAWTSPSGKTIRSALDYALIYFQNPSAWPWATNVSAPENNKAWSWGPNLFESMAGIYNDSTYRDYVGTKRPVYGSVSGVDYHHFAWFYPTLFYGSLTPSGGAPAIAATPVPTPMAAVTKLEAEDQLIRFVSPSTGISNDSAASNGKKLLLNAGAAGHLVELMIPVRETGSFNVKVRVRKSPSLGSYQLTVNGIAQGSVIDCYAATSGYYDVDLGTLNLNTTGDGIQSFMLTCTGKNPSASGYKGEFDTLTFTKINTGTPAPVLAEAESLAVNSVSPSHTVSSSANASGGKFDLLNAGAAGHYVEYSVTVPGPGTYSLSIRAMKYTNNGTYQVTADGVAVGSFDAYMPEVSYYKDFAPGNITFTTAGTHLIRFTCSGKNTSATGYKLPLDTLTLTPQ